LIHLSYFQEIKVVSFQEDNQALHPKPFPENKMVFILNMKKSQNEGCSKCMKGIRDHKISRTEMRKAACGRAPSGLQQGCCSYQLSISFFQMFNVIKAKD
jgi:hypothetical protein